MRELKFRALVEYEWAGKEWEYYTTLTQPIWLDRTVAIVYEKDLQYTGLKEHCNDDTRYNREIYEGDIVEFIDGERLVVEWNDDLCQWQYSDGSPLNNGERYGIYKKIIGNVYENSELLEKELTSAN